MPEHTLPDALHPQQEDAADELQLRGGLKGRFFADFCLLQSTVDALQNYLVHAATPDVQDMAAPLLEEMKQRIFRLERLADNAADLVAQSQPPRQLNWTVQEMTVYLAQLCDAANHELEECAVTGRVRLQPMPQNQPVWAQIDLAIVQTMFANLFSNSLRANPAAKITISCTGRTLEYHDGRIWPEAACAQLAGVQTPEALANGCTGLLLVYRGVAISNKYNLYSGAPGAPLFFCVASGKQNVIMSIFLFSNNGFTLCANYCKIQGKR